MEIEEVFKSPFKLVFSCPSYFSPVKLPGIKFIYRTEEIASFTTTEEIFNLSQVYLKQTIEKYNNYRIEGERVVKTTYRLYIAWEVEKDGLKELEEKDLYNVIYNVEEEEKYIIEEKKYYMLPETIKRKFFYFYGPYCLYFSRRTTRPGRSGNSRRIPYKKIDKIHRMRNMSTKSPKCIIY